MDTFIPAVVVALALTTLCQGQLEVPPRELGFVYKDGRPCATIKIATYLDLTCPDSKEAFPTLLQVADHFGPFDVQLKVHLFSLPYHRNSHVISKGAHVLDAFKSPLNATVFDWFKIAYDNIDVLSTAGAASKTDIQVVDFLAGLAEKVSGISPDAFKTGVAETDIDQATRLEWKYGCTRGVYGTPMFTVNDVFFPANAGWTVAEWVTDIKQLIGDRNRRGQC